MDKQLFTCSQCEKQFKLKRSLNAHQIKIHGVTVKVKHKPFTCATCEKKFTLKGSLNTHQIRIHGISCEVKCKPFSCLRCNKTFTMKKNLKAHEVQKHGVFHENTVYKCATCNLSFRKKTRLMKHIKQNHTAHTVSRNRRLMCPVNSCGELFPSYRRLREHIVSHHKYALEMEQLEFSSMHEFHEWKYQYENKMKVHYVLNTQKRKRESGITYYYFCHRSFYPRQLTNGKYKKPSNKIGKCCPSTVLVKERESCVHVNICHTHIGHTCDIKTIPLSKKDKCIIASKLSDGIPAQQILQEIRSSVADDGLKRIHLLKRKDIYNIRKQFLIECSSERHEDDLNNVKMWVNEITDTHSAPQTISAPNLEITEERKDINEITLTTNPNCPVKSNTDKVKSMTQLILGLSEQTELSAETYDKVVKYLHSAISLMSNERKKLNVSSDADENKTVDQQTFPSLIKEQNYLKIFTAQESTINHELLNDDTDVLNVIAGSDIGASYDGVIVVLNTG